MSSLRSWFGFRRSLPSLLTWSMALWFTVEARAVIDAALQMQTGNPTGATVDAANHTHYLIQRPQYSLDYNDTTHEANWVAWDYTTPDSGSAGRSSVFFQDTTLPAGFYQVLNTDYSGSGYDRGHMSPSADRTASRADNDATFYMSNMVPQSPDNNQGVWANFEGYTRSLAAAGYEILIISGPSMFGGSTIASGVAIPGYTWKIALIVPLTGGGTTLSRINASTRIITIKIPNIAGVRSTPWQNFVTSVSQIEQDTGYIFLTALPAVVANALRPVVDGQSVTGAPAIVSQSGAQTTVVGGTATFSVTASGDAPLTYQWSHDDTEISGATAATLTLGNVQAADVGSYTVVVSNAIGSATSNAAALVVTGLPPSITNSPSAQSVSAGSGVTFTVTAGGSPTLTYQWRRNGLSISGNASATTATLTLTNVQSTDAASYDVVVTNSASSATSAVATLTVNPAAPSITVPPTSKAASTGSNANFTVAATGTAPLSYQWRKNGSALSNGGVISGANSATLLLTGISAVDSANYDVVVTNGLGSATSSAAALTVNPPPPSTVVWDFGPSATPTANPSSGLTADLSGGTITQNNSTSSPSTGLPPLLSTSSPSSTYTGFTAGNNGGAAARIGALNPAGGGSAYFEFTISPSAGKRLLASGLSFGMRSTSTGPQAFSVFTSVDGFSTAVASGTVPNSGNWAFYTPAFTTTTGPTSAAVTFRIYGYNGTGSAANGTVNWRIDDLKLNVTTVFPPPVPPAVIATIPANGATNFAVTSPITITFNEAVSFTGSWFTITSAANGPIAATVNGGPTAFTLTPPSFFAYNDAISVSINTTQVVDQSTGTIHGTTTNTLAFTTESYVPPTPPSVTTQPIAQTVNVGSNVTFTVAASGTAPLSYQWRKGGVNITGNSSATTAALVLTSVTLADAGNFDCVVSNVAGSDVSQTAALTVTVVPPTITTQPVAQMVAVGGNASFTVAASGTAPFAYQWRKGGVPIVGNASATTATLTLSGVTYVETGSYDVVVSNSAGSASSTAVALAVTEASPSAIYWDFATAAPTSGVPVGVTGGTITQANNNGTTVLITSASVSSGYAGASGTNNAGAAARIGALVQVGTPTSGSAYFEFTFTPPAGRQFASTAISFGMRSTSTGPQAFALFTSLDGYTTPVASGPVANDASWHLLTPSLTGITTAAGAPLTFRLFGYNGTGTVSAGTANWRIDDVRLTAGLIALPPAPPTITTQPIAQTATVGDSTSFTVAATGTAPFTYQWRKAGAPISGNATATTATLTLGPITTADAAPYDCVVTNLLGSATSDTAGLSVSKASATVALDPLAFTYDGLPHAATATTAPAHLTVAFTYDGGTTAPTNAGTYAVVATIIDADYLGSTTGTLTIAPASATVALGNLLQVFNGTPRIATASTSPLGIPVTFTYNGGVAPTIAGSYAVVATIADPNYVGSVSGTLVVSKAVATVTLTNTTPTYDGAAKPVTVTTAPTGLATTVTYDGSATAPTTAGSYAVVVTVLDANYAGTASGTLVIGKATATVALGDLNVTYDGLPKAATITMTPASLAIAVTYDGSPIAPTNAGSYSVVATANDTNYAGSASGTLTIAKATATVTLANLAAAYDGTPKSATATTTPANLTTSITYDLSATPPTNAGSYAVAAIVTDPNYAGTASGTLVIAQAAQTIAFNPVPGITFGDAPFTVSATATSGLAVTFSIVSGPATIAGNTVTITGAGPVLVRASQTGSANYGAALDVDQSFTVGKANQSIAFDPIAGVTYGNAPFAVSGSSNSGLAVTFSLVSGPATVADNTVTITGAGAVVIRAAQAGNANYNPAPNVDQTFTVGKANQAIAFAALADTTYGAAPFAVSATSNSGLPVTFTIANGPATIAGNTVTLTSAGPIIVRATQAGDGNTNAAPNVDRTLAVAKATLTVTAQNATRVYGAANPAFAFSYAGFVGTDTASVIDTAPVATTTAIATSNVGTYPITVAGGADDSYAFNYVAGSLGITPASQTIVFAAIAGKTYGDAPFTPTASASSGLPIALSVVSGPASIASNVVTITGAGSVTLRAAQAGNGNFTAATSVDQTFTVVKAAATVALSNLTQSYTGTAKSATVTTTPSGLAVSVTYNGLAALPGAAGSYAVVATVIDPNYTGSATGTLVITSASATIGLSGLKQIYDGQPRVVTVTTSPTGLAANITYNGSATAPTFPGSYAVVATITNANYSGTVSGALVISTAVLVRHAPSFNAGLDGSIEVLQPESMALNGNAYVSGDILVPGAPTVQLNGHPTYVGTVDATGAATPTNYTITLNGNAVLRHVIRRVDAVTMPVVNAPPAPTGTRSVSLNSASDSIGDFATLRNLTLNGNAGTRTIPAGTYGSITVNGNSGIILGVAGATTPSVYNLQGFTLNGNAAVQIVGPVIINLANGFDANSSIGNATHPEWLALNLATGGFALNGNVNVAAFVVAPNGTVTINGNSVLKGGVVADRLTLNGNSLLDTIP